MFLLKFKFLSFLLPVSTFLSAPGLSGSSTSGAVPDMGGSIYSKTQVSDFLLPLTFPALCHMLISSVLKWLVFIIHCLSLICSIFHYEYRVRNVAFCFYSLFFLPFVHSVIWQAGLPHWDTSSLQPSFRIGGNRSPEPWWCSWLCPRSFPTHLATTPTAPLPTAASPSHTGWTGNLQSLHTFSYTCFIMFFPFFYFNKALLLRILDVAMLGTNDHPCVIGLVQYFANV